MKEYEKLGEKKSDWHPGGRAVLPELPDEKEMGRKVAASVGPVLFKAAVVSLVLNRERVGLSVEDPLVQRDRVVVREDQPEVLERLGEKPRVLVRVEVTLVASRGAVLADVQDPAVPETRIKPKPRDVHWA